MLEAELGLQGTQVAPRVGAWIEIIKEWEKTAGAKLSHPVWVRGLKSCSTFMIDFKLRRRTPCGCVD